MPDVHFHALCSCTLDRHQSGTSEEGFVAIGFGDRAGREALACLSFSWPPVFQEPGLSGPLLTGFVGLGHLLFLLAEGVKADSLAFYLAGMSSEP